jgi:uncharacterized protein (TIRG00374 family)
VRWDWRALLGLAISILLILWVLRGVDAIEVWREISAANWWLLAAAIAVATSGFLTRSLRWKVFLQPLNAKTRLSNRFAAVNIGFAANNLLPVRVGEFARAWSISRLEPVTVSGAVGSLVVERFLDAGAILLLLGVAVLHPMFPAGATIGGQPVESAVLGLVVLMAVLFLLLILLVVLPGGFLRVASSWMRHLPGHPHNRLRDLAQSFLQGLESLRHPRLLLTGVVWSVGIWAWNGVSFWLAFIAFGIDQTYAAALFVQAVIALGVAVPSAPGYFGTFHAAAVVGLHEVYGVAEESTLAFAFGYHLGGFFPVTLLGLWYAGRIGLSLADLGHAKEVVKEELHAHPLGGP